MATDPRASIPDTILDAPDGSRWLTRTAQLIVGAGRNQAPRIVVDTEIIPVTSVGADGVAKTLPSATAVRAGRTYSLDEIPPQLAQDLATWMAAQADPNGRALLAQQYPTIDPAALAEEPAS